jgi:conjugative transfer signal peptidase TraF
MLTAAPSRGSFVAVCLPPDVARFGRMRGYLGSGDCPGGIQGAIKQMIAMPGDLVDITQSGIWVNDRRLPDSATAAVDSAGRPLPHVPWGRHRVPPEQVWLLGTGDPRSWDSRYYGPVNLAHIRATLAPVLTLD